MSGAAIPPALTVQINGIGDVNDDYLNTLVQGGGVVLASLRDFVGLSNMLVFMIGTASPNDGGQGFFYWDSTSTTADDGGVLCIAPNGLLTGRWLRLTSNIQNGISSFATFAALRANTATNISAAYVLGYLTAADGGQAIYTKKASVAADNGWGILVDAASQRWFRELLQQTTATGANKTYALTDGNQVINRSNSGTLMVDTLPGTSGALATEWATLIKNNDATAMLVLQVGSGGTIDGTAAPAFVYVGPGQSVEVQSLGGGAYEFLTKPSRAKCVASLTLFITASGSDSANHGLSSGSGFASGLHATSVLYSAFDCNTFIPTISIGNGTYPAGPECNFNILGPPVGVGQLNITGNTGTPSAVVLLATNGSNFLVGSGVEVNISGVKMGASGLIGTGVAGVAMAAYQGSAINFGNVEFSTCQSGHIVATAGANVNSVTQPYAISSTAPMHLNATEQGVVIIRGSTVTITGTPAFSSAFAEATLNSTIDASGATFVGSATGTRWSASLNAVIFTDSGASATFFPGDVNGSASTGGQYE